MPSWSVAECGWKQILPDLPDDVIALLATPVVVTAEALVAPTVRSLPPVVAAADAKVAAAVAAATIEECTPRFLARLRPGEWRDRIGAPDSHSSGGNFGTRLPVGGRVPPPR